MLVMSSIIVIFVQNNTNMKKQYDAL